MEGIRASIYFLLLNIINFAKHLGPIVMTFVGATTPPTPKKNPLNPSEKLIFSIWKLVMFKSHVWELVIVVHPWHLNIYLSHCCCCFAFYISKVTYYICADSEAPAINRSCCVELQYVRLSIYFQVHAFKWK